MNLLKEYIRELVKQTLHEQSLSLPRLPKIPVATGGGAVPDENSSRINSARVSFANEAIEYLNQITQQLTQFATTYASYIANPNFNLNSTSVQTVRNLNSLAEQIINAMNSDTNGWKNIPENVSQIDSLRPEDSALRTVKDETEWAKAGETATRPPDLADKLANVLQKLPEVIRALDAYKNHYQ